MKNEKSYRIVPVETNRAWDADSWTCFTAATMRATGAELIRLDFLQTDELVRSRVRTGIKKALRRLKREGKIQFFIPAEEFSENETATDYVINKYPSLADDEEIRGGIHEYILVRL